MLAASRDGRGSHPWEPIPGGLYCRENAYFWENGDLEGMDNRNDPRGMDLNKVDPCSGLEWMLHDHPRLTYWRFSHEPRRGKGAPRLRG